MTDLNTLNSTLKAEADELLHKHGLLAAMQKYGRVHITGSYFLNTMTWRDLDLYLDSSTMTGADFFMLGHDISNAVGAGKMHYRNEFIMLSGLPRGKYWGIYTNILQPNNWKIDLWAIETRLCDEYMSYARNLKAQINEAKRMMILEIKNGVCMHPDYRKEFTSIDIYNSVIQDGVEGLESFRHWLKEKKNFCL